MDKISAAQRIALQAMPFRVTTWGGKVHGGWPVKGFTQSSVDGLTHRRLAVRIRVGAFEFEYRATDAGRRVLGATT